MKKEGKGKFFVTLRKFMLPFGLVAGFGVFFLIYNKYLVDRSLEDLRFTLEQIAKAADMEEMMRVGILLDDFLINEVSSLKINSLDMIKLEFAKNIIIKGHLKEQLKDIEFLLSKIVLKKEKQRGVVLLAFDRINADLQKLIKFFIKELPRGAVRPEIFKPTENIDLSLLDAARNYESNGQLKEAINAYEEFINKYPAYPQLLSLKLQLASAYFKSTDYKEAKRQYERLIEEAPQSDEAKIAELLLTKVKDKIAKQQEEKRLSDIVSKLVKTGPIQVDFNELSLVDSYFERLDKETEELVLYIMEGAKIVSEPVAPGVDLTLLNKARLAESNWMLRDAQSDYEEFIATYPTYERTAFVKLLLSGVYLKSMQYEKARASYEEIIKNYPHSKEAEFAQKLIEKTDDIILVYRKRQTLLNNIRKFKTTLELTQAYYTLGVTDAYLYDFKKAEEAFKKVIELLPETELARRAMFNLGWVYKFEAEYNKSIATFSQFVQENPDHPLVLDSEYYIADSYYKSGRFEEAAKIYERVADKFPDSPLAVIAQLQTGYTYLYNLHDPLRASSAFKKLKDRYPETDATSYVSDSLLPSTERSYRDYGFILLREGRYSEAKEAFNKAVLINKDDGWAYCGLGTANVLLVLFDTGIEYTEAGVNKIKDEYTHAALAFSYDRKGMYDKAIDEYRRSISKNPNYVISHYNLGRIYAIKGWYDLAIDEFKKTIKLVQSFAEAHCNLGCVYWYKGQFVDAEFEFKEAIYHKENSIEAYYNLGLLYEINEKYDKAETCFRKVLSLMPDFETAQRKLERINKIKRR
ncbi:MAG: tetratricopeptide repeat protein [Candidatus Omnitrophica bacterium]|nr:tetratricopeptide repeat protein [Candidatus Omnitrophota bacterium]